MKDLSKFNAVNENMEDYHELTLFLTEANYNLFKMQIKGMLHKLPPDLVFTEKEDIKTLYWFFRIITTRFKFYNKIIIKKTLYI